MTCIVGVVHDGRAWLGADSVSADTGQWHCTSVRDPKVFHAGPLVLGFTSSWRMGQLLRYQFIVPPRSNEIEAHRWLATDFVEAVRKLLTDHGFAKKENNVEEGGLFLVGLAGRLYRVEPDYHVADMATPYAAVGCGEDYALGALHATADLKWGPHQRIRRALRAAATFSAYVRAPFRILAEP